MSPSALQNDLGHSSKRGDSTLSSSHGTDIIELRINKGTLYPFLMGRGDFSLPARSVSAKAGRLDCIK